MTNEYYRTLRESGAGRVVPDITLWYYGLFCPEPFTLVNLDAQRFLVMRITKHEPEAL